MTLLFKLQESLTPTAATNFSKIYFSKCGSATVSP